MKKFSELKTRNKIFFGTLAFEAAFIITMIITYYITGDIPNTLCDDVLGGGGVIASITGGMSLADIVVDAISDARDAVSSEQFEDIEVLNNVPKWKKISKKLFRR